MIHSCDKYNLCWLVIPVIGNDICGCGADVGSFSALGTFRLIGSDLLLLQQGLVFFPRITMTVNMRVAHFVLSPQLWKPRMKKIMLRGPHLKIHVACETWSEM